MASKIDRVGKTRVMKCGMKATIIRYGGYNDIDIRFEDGKVVVHKAYGNFKKGNIANQDIKASAENRLGETRMMKCGMAATIIRYGNTGDIDVCFEDDTIIEHRQYGQFKKGAIVNRDIKASAENRLGETRMMNCGMEATIIRYGGATDIDVRFEDGAVAKNKAYGEFKKGGIAHPSTTAKARLGETRMMNCGMKATIIRYENADDINICFEDGKVVEHKTYRAFKKGYIAHQNTNVPIEAHLGETRMMNCGMEATIIRYEGNTNIDVRFEDENVVEHKTYNAFKKGNIAHRSLSLKYGSKDFHGFVCKQGFIDEDRTLYECICKHCGLEDVLTPQEMIDHEKLEHGEGE